MNQQSKPSHSYIHRLHREEKQQLWQRDMFPSLIDIDSVPNNCVILWIMFMSHYVQKNVTVGYMDGCRDRWKAWKHNASSHIYCQRGGIKTVESFRSENNEQYPEFEDMLLSLRSQWSSTAHYTLWWADDFTDHPVLCWWRWTFVSDWLITVMGPCALPINYAILIWLRIQCLTIPDNAQIKFKILQPGCSESLRSSPRLNIVFLQM